MIAMQIKLSALKRAAIDPKDRKPFYLYIDEFQNYVSKSIESILSEARKYKLGLTIAHQYIEQLKQK
jgi:type IV secretory pathway TraG/TraD family ATPase VirD4